MPILSPEFSSAFEAQYRTKNEELRTGNRSNLAIDRWGLVNPVNLSR